MAIVGEQLSHSSSPNSNPSAANPWGQATNRKIFALAAQVNGQPVKIAFWGKGGATYYVVGTYDGVSTYTWGTEATLESLTGHSPLPGLTSGNNVFTADVSFAGLRSKSDGSTRYWYTASTIPHAAGTPTSGTDLICLFYCVGTDLYEVVVQYHQDGTVTAVCTTSGLTLTYRNGGGSGHSNYQHIDGRFEYDGSSSGGVVPYAAGFWNLALCYGTSSGNVCVAAVHDTLTASGTGVITGISLSKPYHGLDSLVTGGNWRSLVLKVAGTSQTNATLFIGVFDDNSAQVKLVVVDAVDTGTYFYTKRTTEVVGLGALGPLSQGGAHGSFDMALRVGGAIDFAYFKTQDAYGPAVFNYVGYISRSAGGTYSSIQGINSDVNDLALANAFPVLSTDVGSGNLYVFFESYQFRTNGEVWYSRLEPGASSWESNSPIGGTSNVVAGVSNAGFGYVGAIEAFSTSGSPPTGLSHGSDILYVVGTASPFQVWWDEPSAGSAPSAPDLLTPAGPVVGTLTPTFTFDYNNPSFDLQEALEAQVTTTGGSPVTMWDSGKVGSSGTPDTATSFVYGAIGASATGLSYKVQYQWRLKNWDQALDAAGPYSGYTTFVCYQTPAASLIAGGAVVKQGPSGGGATIAPGGTAIGPILTVTGIATDADNLVVNQGQIDLLDPTHTTVLSTTGPFPVSGAGATSGGASVGPGQGVPDFNFQHDHVLPGVTIDITGGTTYYLRARFWYQDAFSSASIEALSPAADFAIVPSFTHPNPVASIVAVPNPSGGYTTLTWVAAGSEPAGVTLAGYQAQYRLHGGTVWNDIGALLDPGTLTLEVKQYLNVAWDFRVLSQSTLGAVSTDGATPVASDITLVGVGVWLDDVKDPTNRAKSVNLRGFNTGDWETTTLRGRVTNPKSYVPAGSKAQITTFDGTNYFSATGLKWLVEGERDNYDGSPVYATDVQAAIESILETDVSWRDVNGGAYVGTLSNYKVNDLVLNREIYHDFNEERGWVGVVISA